jgi:hypothetical protein
MWHMHLDRNSRAGRRGHRAWAEKATEIGRMRGKISAHSGAYLPNAAKYPLRRRPRFNCLLMPTAEADGTDLTE